MLRDKFIYAVLILFFTSFCFADVSVSPLGIMAALPDGDEPDGPLTIRNDGEEAVEFSIRVRNLHWEMEEEAGGYIEPWRDDRGGPDDATYEWRDSNEDDGPVYNWIDITEFEDAENVENLADDSYHGMFELGFEIEYYGEVYNSVGFHTNGWASFVEAREVVFHWPDWGPLPTDQPGAPNNTPPPTMLAVMDQDFDPLRDGEIWFWTNEQNQAIIQWNEIQHWEDQGVGNGDPWTFQVIVNASGLIVYQYQVLGSEDMDRRSILVGFQNEARDLGFTMVNDEYDYIEEEMAIAFGPEDSWITWLTFDPEAGEIEAGGETEIELTIVEEELEAESVNIAELVIRFNELGSISIPVIVSNGAPTGSIAGAITGAADDQPIEGAMIVAQPSGVIRYSDEEGAFDMINMPAGEYALTCNYGEYFDFVLDEVIVEDGEETDASMALLHAECNPDIEGIEVEISPGDQTERDFSVSNDGNAPLTYSVERRLPGNADADPWELRNVYNVGEDLDDARVNGVVFIDDRFYVASDGDNDPVIYILNRDGELVETLQQPTEERRGMNDLAWDGELIWGAIDERIIGFDLEGEVQVEFEGQFNPTNSLAWDPDREWLWTCGTTTDIVAINREGARQAELDRQDLRMYGLAYWEDDPDGMPLYVFAKDRDTDLMVVYKNNPDEGEMELVRFLEPEMDASPEGAFISNEFDVYSWVFIHVANISPNDGGDHIMIWQLDARRDWFSIEPAEGVIEAEEEQEFHVVLDAAELPPVEFEGEFVFSHDGFGRETVIPVTLDVVQGPVHSQRTLQLLLGWNLVSLNLQPDEEDVTVITQPLVENDLLELMKDGMGRFYNPEFNFNNIPGWEVSEGYQMKLTAAAELTVEGVTVMADDPIELIEGWNMIAYYPREPVDAVTALSGIEEQLIMAKDGMGRFYNTEFGFSNMGPMREGQGYQVKLREDAELRYRLEEEGVNLFDGSQPVRERLSNRILPDLKPTGSNMSLLVLGSTAEAFEIGVYAGDKLVGSGVFSGGAAGFVLWGDDPTTKAIDGALADDELSLKVFKDGQETPVEYVTKRGASRYITDDFWVVELNGSAEPPVEFGLNSVYPNPFNSQLLIKYSLPELRKLTLELTDVSGRSVQILENGWKKAGSHETLIEGAELTSGVYFVEMRAGAETAVRKVVLIR